MENYQFIKTIGKGSFGKVKLAIHKLTNIQVAIKIISKALMSTKKNSQKRLQMELQILQKIRHPNIISLFEILENDHFVYLVLEYASGGELFDYIVAHTKLDEDLSRRFFRQIIDGIDYCHRLNVVHRDIKPENILIDDQNNIKIIDFGLSNFFHPNDLLQTFCGSPLYSAPEVISQKKYDGRKSDIWSAGVVLYTLLCGKLPFPGTNHKEVCEKILNGKFTIPQHVSLLAKDLLVKMIEFDTQKRITIDQIRAHQWFNLGYNGPPIRRPISTDLIQNIDTDIIRELQMLNVPSDKVIHSLDSAVFDSFTASYLLIQFKKMQLNSQKINLVDNDKSLKFENSLAQIPQEIITKKDPSKNTSKNFKNFAINKEVHKISSPIQNQFQFNKSPNKNQDENSQLLINMSEEEKTKRKKNEFKMKYLPNKMNEDQQIQTNLNNSNNLNNLNNLNNSKNSNNSNNLNNLNNSNNSNNLNNLNNSNNSNNLNNLNNSNNSNNLNNSNNSNKIKESEESPKPIILSFEKINRIVLELEMGIENQNDPKISDESKIQEDHNLLNLKEAEPKNSRIFDKGLNESKEKKLKNNFNNSNNNVKNTIQSNSLFPSIFPKKENQIEIEKLHSHQELNEKPKNKQNKMEIEGIKRREKRKAPKNQDFSTINTDFKLNKIRERSTTIHIPFLESEDIRKPRSTTIPTITELKSLKKEETDSFIEETREISGPFQVSSLSTKTPQKIIKKCQKILKKKKIAFSVISAFVLKCKVDSIEFEIETGRIPNLKKFTVVKFKRVSGNCWSFQKVWNQIAQELK